LVIIRHIGIIYLTEIISKTTIARSGGGGQGDVYIIHNT
jgi:hypothetical protein